MIDKRVVACEKHADSFRRAYAANILVISGDPLADIANLRNVKTVLQAGKAVAKNGMLRPSASCLRYPIQ
jgi:imidazolonepropionase-like amidohydrolase